MKLIDKDALVAEIDRLENKLYYGPENFKDVGAKMALDSLKSSLGTLEAKESSLTWEDIRELYIIFAEVDVEIELCRTDIQAETIGYYQEVLKRFKDLKERKKK